jgi:hypothetical protein
MSFESPLTKTALLTSHPALESLYDLVIPFNCVITPDCTCDHATAIHVKA